jgi:molybdopterin molybdotransferase
MRKSVDPDTALALVLESTRELMPREVALEEALGCVLDEAARADRDYPPFDRAAMDGFAVRLSDRARTVPIIGELAAGRLWPDTLAGGTAIEIMTGAPCPKGAEAVVPKEDALRDGEHVTLPAAFEAGLHIARRGSECRAGSTVVQAGALVTPLVTAVLANFGVLRPRVIPRPRVFILVTGDEIAPLGSEPQAAQIRDSNGAMLAALARQEGATVTGVRFAPDTPEALRRSLAETSNADLVLVTGGVSAGKYDLVPSLLTELGVELVFHKVTQKPGKPLLFGRGPAQLFLALPGNPLSTHLGFCRYAAAALAKMSRRALPPPEHGRLARRLVVKGERTSFVLARASRVACGLSVEPLVGQGSADIFASAYANAYLRFAPGRHELEADTPVELTWAGPPG